ncbi:hypothetical protein [Tautonia marina]|uniref:hypothetical protein n=1 Tax=Tautonia marina TaxID=2653855 RepID=UPI001260C3BC|nr:hypothetical protein [Tautonia marina]
MTDNDYKEIANQLSSIKDSDWSLSQEREFMENLVSQRFYFYFVIYSFVIIGAFAADTKWKALSILISGFIFTYFVLVTIARADYKLDQILRLLHRTPNHPVRVSGLLAEGIKPSADNSEQLSGHVCSNENRSTGNFDVLSPKDFIGWLVPMLAWIVLGLLCMLVVQDVLKFKDDSDCQIDSTYSPEQPLGGRRLAGASSVPNLDLH